MERINVAGETVEQRQVERSFRLQRNGGSTGWSKLLLSLRTTSDLLCLESS